ncbi:cobalamin-binding protein [Aquisalimonas sp.]|uniref:cobalamin-binding protein n=2 Tax=Aquisalimonas sp. TaxID=1872621 RepID=UPI0025BA6624|nr:cobalamin-binding protein [Aquisalimonas sp.]
MIATTTARTPLRILAGLAVTGILGPWQVIAADEPCVTDDADREVCLDAPAERIVSLSPGATELLFAAGAGDAVVGAVSYSDYPPEAEEVPRVGSYKRLDMETLLAREPDLIVGWITGNPSEQLERLQELGVPLYLSEPRELDDIASTLERLGVLTGTAGHAADEATAFRDAIDGIRDEYADAEPVRVFYQVWDDPLMTVNDAHLISQAAALCGGDNVFGELGSLTPRIDTESVLDRDPEAIVAGGMGEADETWLEPWRGYDSLTATRRDNLFFVPPSSIQRPTPRVAEGSRILCEQLERARERR